MQAHQLPIQVSAASFFPAPIGNLIRPFEPQLLRFLFTDTLMETYVHAARDGATGADFAGALLQELNIRYEVRAGDLGRIPKTGPAVVVANHPFGFLEGLVLMCLLRKVRPDYRFVVNQALGSVEQLRDFCILVNPFAEQGAARENARGLRRCYEWLDSNGLLVVFPAGEVAHFNWGGERPVADPKWRGTAARIARRLGCPMVPLYFDGTNSLPFQMMGTIHPRLRTLNLARELVKKQRRIIPVRVGNPVPPTVLRGFADAEAATGYLRARVYLLGNRIASASVKPEALRRSIRIEESRDVVAHEVAALPAECLLANGEEFDTYLADAEQIPRTLHEIGRCRELTFRAVGEGTGESLDLDRFDGYYQHLFLWSNKDRQIAGAYRIAATADVLPKYGPGGLYTSTLFQYTDGFFERLGPAFELGRSFIRAEYQRHYAPLLLLWKGIAACVARRPACPVLFGAVSISRHYQPLSRALIIDFVAGHMASDLSGMVKPRRGYRKPLLVPKHVKRLGSLLKTVDELSDSISDLEADGKGVPVLIRQYVKLGGQFLGFNVDPNFSDALDGLIVADVRKVQGPMLDRVLGKAGAAMFRAHHKLGVSAG
jgi:putative hemolysin